jgi:serine/threonine-protein kinase
MSLIFIQGEEEKNRNIHYEVDPKLPSLGEGGMGQVLRGVMVNEKNGVRQDVAIKFLFEDLPVHAIERAKREASIQIHNENLVEMFGFIEVVDGNGTKRYHVVSELLQGVMLFDLLNGKTTDKYGNEIEFAQELFQQYQNDKFSFAVFIVKNILSGLMALHDKGYIHRDLDPSNIMITHDKKVKIIDFGIAKQLNSLNTQDQQLTSTGQFVGKAAYAAPELVLGDVRSQDKSTDIYAVGIMLYQFIVGSLPFEGTMAELIKKQINEKLPLKNVPYKAIRRIIEKATAKKQADRYQSASEMRVDLEHLSKQDAQPSTTSFDSFPDIGGSKKRIGIIAASVVVLLAVIGGIFFSVNSGPSEEELAKARKDSLFQVRNGQVIDSPETNIIIDPESGAKMTPINMLADKALKALEDSASMESGLMQLREIIDKYSSYKHSAPVLALMAAITQPEDATIAPERVKMLRRLTADKVQRNARRAHELAEMAVNADPQCYQALFELATDYVAGEIRTGSPSTPAPNKALKMYKDGLAYAQNNNDNDYISLFNTRIEQVSQLLQ